MAQLSIHTLRGKQSVRVTFQLAPETIDLLSVMALQLGIKQKTLFESLIEHQDLKHLSQPHEKETVQKQNRRQKTFVLSQKTLETLNLLTEKYQAPRNLLVERSIHLLLPILETEQEKHKKRKIFIQQIAQLVSRSEELLIMAQKNLGANDPVCQHIGEATRGWQNTYEEIIALIERGKGMDRL